MRRTGAAAGTPTFTFDSSSHERNTLDTDHWSCGYPLLWVHVHFCRCCLMLSHKATTSTCYDARYDRGSTFWPKVCLTDGGSSTKEPPNVIGRRLAFCKINLMALSACTCGFLDFSDNLGAPVRWHAFYDIYVQAQK